MLSINNKNFCANLTLKKLLMLTGLLLVLLSVFEQTSDDYDYQGGSNAIVSILQIDKDHQRDVEKAFLVLQALGSAALLMSAMFTVYHLLYQEPVLLVHHRPPNI